MINIVNYNPLNEHQLLLDQLEIGLRNYIPIKPIVAVIGSYLEDKNLQLFKFVVRIAYPSSPQDINFRAEVIKKNLSSRKLVLDCNKMIEKMGSPRYHQFSYFDFLSNRVSFSELQDHEARDAEETVHEFLKGNDLERNLVELLTTSMSHNIKRNGLEKSLGLFKEAASNHNEIGELVSIAHQIVTPKLLDDNFLKFVKKLLVKDVKYLSELLIFQKIEIEALIASLIESDLGNSKTVCKIPGEEERDLDVPINKGEFIVSLLVEYDKGVQKNKVQLERILNHASFYKNRENLSLKDYEEKLQQFLAKFSFRTPFPSDQNSRLKLLGDYFVEGALDYLNRYGAIDDFIRRSIFRNIGLYFANGASPENAWKYVIEKYKQFEQSPGPLIRTLMLRSLLEMQVPIEESSLIYLLNWDLSLVGTFRPNYEKEEFDKILRAVIQKKIDEFDFLKGKISDNWASRQLNGILELLNLGVVPSEDNIKKLKEIFNFLRPDNNLAYFKGKDFNPYYHYFLKRDEGIHVCIAKIKSKIGLL